MTSSGEGGKPSAVANAFSMPLINSDFVGAGAAGDVAPPPAFADCG
jgi:hypothetical protein